MLTVELKMLPGETETAARFLQSRIQSPIEIHGNRIEIGDGRVDEIKLLLHKFLRREGLDGYRVLSEHGNIRVVMDEQNLHEKGRTDDKVKGVPPFPPLSSERLPLMGVVYPNYSSQGYGYKKKKR